MLNLTSTFYIFWVYQYVLIGTKVPLGTVFIILLRGSESSANEPCESDRKAQGSLRCRLRCT